MKRELAAVLNIVVWGLGYLYLGTRTVMGGLLLGGYLLIHWFWVVKFGAMSALTSPDTLVVFGGHLLLSASFAYDVYYKVSDPGRNDH